MFKGIVAGFDIVVTILLIVPSWISKSESKFKSIGNIVWDPEISVSTIFILRLLLPSINELVLWISSYIFRLFNQNAFYDRFYIIHL